MRTQRRPARTATISLPHAGVPATVCQIHGALFDPDVPAQDAGLHQLLVRATGTMNLPGLHDLGPDHRITYCGQTWEIVGEATHWLNRTKVRVQEAKPPLHCTIRPAGAVKDGDFDETTGTFPSTPLEAYFTGVVRAQQASTEARALVVAEDDITTLAYVVCIPTDLNEVNVGDVVALAELDEATGSPIGTPVELYVKAVNRVGLVWEHDLICTDKI